MVMEPGLCGPAGGAMTETGPMPAGLCRRRIFAFAGAFALALAAAACGDSEPDQRKAFIKFLDDINRRTGVHFLVPTDADRAAFGDYMRHYTVILDFNKDMKVISADYQDAMKKVGVGPNVQPQTFEQLVARRQTFPVLRDITNKSIESFEQRLAKADGDRASLQQPEDLKIVYKAAFDKLVAAPVQAMIASDKALLVMLDSSEKIAGYVDQHRTRVTVSGSQVRASDARTLAELNALIKAHQDAQQAFQDAQRNGDRVVNGR
jgi:hypothetical protein